MSAEKLFEGLFCVDEFKLTSKLAKNLLAVRARLAGYFGSWFSDHRASNTGHIHRQLDHDVMVRATHGPRNRRKPWPVDPSKRPLQVETRLGLISSFPTEGIPTTNKGYPTPSGRGVDSQKQQSLVGFVFAPADFEAILATTLRRVITEELANLQDNDEVIDKEGAAR